MAKKDDIETNLDEYNPEESEKRIEDYKEQDFDLTIKQKIFCKKYTYDWNATKAYRAAYPDCNTDHSAGTNGHKLLKNAEIQAYIKWVQIDIEKLAGISKQLILDELRAAVTSNVGKTRTTWMTMKEFESLDKDTKRAISEIQTTTKEYTVDEATTKEVMVKVRFHSKTEAAKILNQMLGYNEPDKVDHTTGGESIRPQLTNDQVREIVESLKPEDGSKEDGTGTGSSE